MHDQFSELFWCRACQAYHWMRQSRGSDSFKLAEFLPAEPALERLMEVLGLEPQQDDGEIPRIRGM